MIAAAAVVLLVGPLSLMRRDEWWDGLEHPWWSPGARVAVVSGLVAAVAEAIAVWIVWGQHGWSLPVYLWLAHVALAPLWWALAVGLERLSAAFSVLCADWTALAIAAAAFSAYAPAAGWIVGVSLAWLTWMGASLFFLWQANQPSRRR